MDQDVDTDQGLQQSLEVNQIFVCLRNQPGCVDPTRKRACRAQNCWIKFLCTDYQATILAMGKCRAYSYTCVWTRRQSGLVQEVIGRVVH